MRRILSKFNIKNLGGYKDLYNMGDASTLLGFVADFKEDMNRKYGTESLNSITFPSYLWECALKITGIKLKFLTDIHMLFGYENGIRGRMSTVTRHFLEAKNKNIADYE